MQIQYLFLYFVLATHLHKHNASIQVHKFCRKNKLKPCAQGYLDDPGELDDGYCPLGRRPIFMPIEKPYSVEEEPV